MDQCKETVDVNKEFVYTKNCKTSCFVRIGDDGAMYRGCFDGFMEVGELKELQNYHGCRNQTWNNKDLEWCLCQDGLCNYNSMYDMGSHPGYYMKKQSADETNQVDARDGKSGGDGDIFMPEAQALTQENYGVKEINHAAYFAADPKEQRLDDFNPGRSKLPEESEPEEEVMPPQQYQQHLQQQEEYDPYSQPRFERPDYEEQKHFLEPSQYAPEDAYMYPPFKNEPPYGNPVFYHENNFVEAPSQYELPPPEIYQEYPQELYPNPIQFEAQVQEDYPPPRLEYKEYVEQPEQEVVNEVVEEEPVQKKKKPAKEPFPEHLAARIQCAKTGFYQNPDDCRTFVACVLDPYYRKPYMHLMRCPEGLVWDNDKAICMEYSSTCNVQGSFEEPAPTEYEQPEAKEYDNDLPPEEPYYEENPSAQEEIDYEQHDATYEQPANQEEPVVEEQAPSYFPPQDRSGYYEATGEQVEDERYYQPVNDNDQPRK